MTPDPDTDLTLTRTLAAPRGLLWACWTTPKHIRNFFVPKPHSVAACEIDLRVGGRVQHDNGGRGEKDRQRGRLS